jgi:Tol biopolymer transport system component
MRKFAEYCSAVLLMLAAGPLSAGALITELISVNPATGAQADGPSDAPALSADGCIVAFTSESGTLAPPSYGLTKTSVDQVYAVNRCVSPHTIELVSVTDDGTTASDRACFYPNISADGRYVSFITSAGNLPVPNSGPSGQVFLVFVRDRLTQTTTSPLEAWRTNPSDGAGIYYDTLGETARQTYMSADASEFAFEFFDGVSATTDVDAFHVSGATTSLQTICVGAARGLCSRPQISGDGSTITFTTSYPLLASDTNGRTDVYAYNTATTNVSLVSITADNMQSNNEVDPANDIGLSNDGNVVAFSTDSATNFPGNHAFTLVAKNRASGDMTLVSAAPGGVAESPDIFGIGQVTPSLSTDGNRIAFASDNEAITPYPATTASFDAVVADLTLKRLGSACISATGAHGNNGCNTLSISADGKWLAFRSSSDNLVPNDANGKPDIFVVALDPAVDDVFASGFEP